MVFTQIAIQNWPEPQWTTDARTKYQTSSAGHQKEAQFVVRETGPTSRTSSLKILCLWRTGWTSKRIFGASGLVKIRHGTQQILGQNQKLDMSPSLKKTKGNFKMRWNVVRYWILMCYNFQLMEADEYIDVFCLLKSLKNISIYSGVSD